MKLLNCALVALALSGTGCGSESSLSPRVLQISGTVRQQDGTAVSGAKVAVIIGESTLSSTLSDPAGHFVLVAPANQGSVTLRASEPPPAGPYVGTLSGIVRVEGSPGSITIDIVLDHFDPI
jgi:carboxypeptidase family protein